MSLHKPGLVSVALLALTAVCVPAQAAPVNDHTFELLLSCDDGGSYRATVVDNEGQSPAHVLDSRSVFIPTGFGEFYITVTDTAGNLLDEIVAPPEVAHGRSGDQVATLHCAFAQTELEDIPGVGEVVIHAEGTADGFLSR